MFTARRIETQKPHTQHKALNERHRRQQAAEVLRCRHPRLATRMRCTARQALPCTHLLHKRDVLRGEDAALSGHQDAALQHLRTHHHAAAATATTPSQVAPDRETKAAGGRRQGVRTLQVLEAFPGPHPGVVMHHAPPPCTTTMHSSPRPPKSHRMHRRSPALPGVAMAWLLPPHPPHTCTDTQAPQPHKPTHPARHLHSHPKHTESPHGATPCACMWASHTTHAPSVVPPSPLPPVCPRSPCVCTPAGPRGCS